MQTNSPKPVERVLSIANIRFSSGDYTNPMTAIDVAGDELGFGDDIKADAAVLYAKHKTFYPAIEEARCL